MLKVIPPFISKIDWKLLRSQKRVLNEMRMRTRAKDKAALDGIMHLLDALQDYAHDELGIKAVFESSKDEEHEP